MKTQFKIKTNREEELQRKQWLTNRRQREKQFIEKEKKRRNLFKASLSVLDKLLNISRLEKITRKLAMRVNLVEHELSFPNLPKAFDGYCILHITDTHFDFLPGIEDKIIEVLPAHSVDMLVFTGDYREGTSGDHLHVLNPMKKLMSHIDARDGIFATLGNHDPGDMVVDLENIGIQCLVNESHRISRQGQEIVVTGTDDVNRYFTPQALRALQVDGDFKIAFVHSNELMRQADENKYSLYLCGHTHGGQICLPTGIPLCTHSLEHRRFARGLWQLGQMTGYTSPGAGSIGVAMRAFCHAEVTLFTLRRESA